MNNMISRLFHSKARASVVVLLLLLTAGTVSAQEALLPVRHQGAEPTKSSVAVRLPFFDDFSNGALSESRWLLGGTFVNEGYATEQMFSCDTLESLPIRLDTLFQPFQRPLSAADSLYLSFFYLPGGGYGNMWERLGDTPEAGDSLVLEFYDSANDTWNWIWSSGGCAADTLFAQTGRYWQFHDVCISDAKYFNADFRFRFRNYSSLSNLNKKGLLSNADQWNIDYVLLNAGRHRGDTASRDVAFVNPAPSLLHRYQAMPARQFSASEMADAQEVTITNLFSEELAADYHYHIY